jgi:glutathione S-transferase
MGADIAAISGKPKEKFMFTLHARPGAGSFAVEALLAELELPFKIIDVPRNPEQLILADYHKINPRGEIPTLLLPDNNLMTESAAMLIYLADSHPAAGLAPGPTAPERPVFLRWVLYFATAVYMADLRFYYPDRYSTDPNAGPGVKAAAVKHMDRDFAIFADWLGSKRFILGEKYSAADLYVAMLLSWAPDVAEVWKRHPNLKRLYDGVAARPKIKKAWLRNEMP